MSLLARAAQDACVKDVGSDDDLFRQRVWELLSADAVAKLMAQGEERARGEVRAVCRQVLMEPAWNEAPSQERQRLTDGVLASVFGFGPLQRLLDDPEVTEVMVNGTTAVFYEEAGQIHFAGNLFSSEEEIRTVVDRIIGPLGRRLDELSPLVNARMPQGHRVNAVIPPIALDGTAVTIRKFPERLITLDDLVLSGSASKEVRQLLEWAVRARKNIAVSGGTGSGKTTLLNALSCCIPSSERIVTIEDSAELRFLQHPDVVRLEARLANSEGNGEVTIRDLVVNALRMRPDRIIVGECRGGEALDMLQAMNTGHDGSLTTLHANSASEVVSRLETMVRYVAALPVDVVDAYIGSAFDLIVHTARWADGRRCIAELASVGFDPASRTCIVETFYKRTILDEEGKWIGVPPWLSEAVADGSVDSQEVEPWFQAVSLL